MAQKGWQYLLVFLAYLSLTLAASKSNPNCTLKSPYSHRIPAPTTFCKCTCFSNSTIIPFDAYSPSDTTQSNNSETRRARTCNDCTKQFCLDSNLPICEKATETDVFTLCFQRDSTKDQAVIYIFIIATIGLLAWAAVKPWVVQWSEKTRARYRYTPVAEGMEGAGGQ